MSIQTQTISPQQARQNFLAAQELKKQKELTAQLEARLGEVGQLKKDLAGKLSQEAGVSKKRQLQDHKTMVAAQEAQTAAKTDREAAEETLAEARELKAAADKILAEAKKYQRLDKVAREKLSTALAETQALQIELQKKLKDIEGQKKLVAKELFSARDTNATAQATLKSAKDKELNLEKESKLLDKQERALKAAEEDLIKRDTELSMREKNAIIKEGRLADWEKNLKVQNIIKNKK